MGNEAIPGTSPWHEAPEVPEAPDAPASSQYVELPESGWGALVAWNAGPNRLVRCRDSIDRHTTTETVVSNAEQYRSELPRTAEDQAGIDDDINEYLHAASIPGRPSGYRWFLVLPPDCTEDQFWDHVHRDLSEHSDATHPSAITAHVRSSLAEIYREA
jgi:hypothetical protein